MTATATTTTAATTSDGVQRAHRALAERLGDQLPAGWRAAYDVHPRHLFLPDRVWVTLDESLDRLVEPDRWLAYAYGDDSVITQLHDGAECSAHGYPISSSCSMPAVVFTMLGHLDPQCGERILEIGTGTGWTAALLAHQLGDDHVVSVEVDPAVADTARRNLTRAGRELLVITGDGAEGYSPGAPYDRVIATCSVQTVPYPWVAQTRPGGVILTPWGSTFENSALLRLTVDQSGERAVGCIVDWAAFMRLRAQRPVIPGEPDVFDAIADRGRTDVDLADLLGEHARFGIGLRVPDCRLTWELGDDGYLSTLWLLAPDSWASVHDTVVRQAGTRRLWDEVTTAYSRWQLSGRPSRDRYGVTVTADRQWVWLDDPTQPVTTSS
ncbi:MAG: methyltransferase domain-containing protein [Pseudonocardiaceae bacterium]